MTQASSTSLKPQWPKLIQQLEHRHSDAFKDAVTLAACVCACGAREDEYRAIARKYTRDEFSLLTQTFADFVRLKADDPFADLFGDTYMERMGNWGKKRFGEFYTPTSVARLMARMSMHKPELGYTLTLGEPAGGSGALVLASAEALEALEVSRLHLQVLYTDINPFAVDMALVNLGLAGIPAVLRHGNSLTNEVWHTWETPAWRFARPYEGEFIQVGPSYLMLMLSMTVPPPVPVPPQEPVSQGAWGVRP